MVKGGLQSMTGFAAGRGRAGDWSWAWDIRSVNGKGFDLRLRLPDWVEGLEAAVRAEVAGQVARGSVTLSLRLARDAGAEALRPGAAALAQAVAAVLQAEAAAKTAGLALRPTSAADLLAMKGVLDSGGEDQDMAPLRAALLADLPGLLQAFNAMRRSEGAALSAVIAAQIDRIEALAAEARAAAEARRGDQDRALNDNLARVLQGAAEADPARVAQELAMLVVKADVTEELDRLAAHVGAARTLLASGGAVGKTFDFLMQEFMREANTLCSKSGNVALTRIGLDLKTTIDQMREQVQNVE